MRSQSKIAVSPPADASIFPLGEKASLSAARCPVKIWCSGPQRSQTSIGAFSERAPSWPRNEPDVPEPPTNATWRPLEDSAMARDQQENSRRFFPDAISQTRSVGPC